MVAAKVKSIVSEWAGIKLEDITLESDFTEDLALDSLDLVQLALAFEEAFNIEIPDADAENLRTVKQVIDYIESKVNKT